MASSTISLPPDFHFIESFHLLVCSRHQIAIPPTQVNQHLKHHFMSHEMSLNQYKEVLSTLTIGPIYESHGLIRAVEPIQPIPFLGKVKKGYACGISHCHHLAISLPNLRRHLREKHGRGGSTSQQASWIESIPLQSLYDDQYLFTVLPSEVSFESSIKFYIHILIYISRRQLAMISLLALF